ncbi:DNA gyrase inhibitor YacG [Aliidiomarina halalkaliphila]|uniref:DNA gyrase inhibitor YacG n=1 Tax=Aliidiomarina halalkaliphila TaxID=2593535 RepID=A0A552X618_9GAMM|nr:DNA gyrase inhibitor YacG [Aliidiomarina halalkaliphila]TRW50399.1 DNA gyrase inhibitor YacG [Aliidiomarina halalkaliphila]
MNKVTIVACPTCNTPVRWEPASKFRPFCSERCKLIDLGEWASEEKRIPGDDIPPHANDDENI